MSNIQTVTRKRSRKIEVTEVSPEEEIKSLVAEYFVANRLMNRYKGTADKAREKCYQKMKELGLAKMTDLTIDHEGQRFIVDATVLTPEGDEVSIDKLSKITNLETLLSVVSATQKAVRDKLGTSVLNQCLVTKMGDERVDIKARK